MPHPFQDLIDLLGAANAANSVLSAYGRDPLEVVLAESLLWRLCQRAAWALEDTEPLPELRFWQEWVAQLTEEATGLLDRKRALLRDKWGLASETSPGSQSRIMALVALELRTLSPCPLRGVTDDGVLKAFAAAPVVARRSTSATGVTILRMSCEHANRLEDTHEAGIAVLGAERLMTNEAWELFDAACGRYTARTAYKVCADAVGLLGDGETARILLSLVTAGVPADELITTALAVRA